MSAINENLIRDVVAEVLGRLGQNHVPPPYSLAGMGTILTARLSGGRNTEYFKMPMRPARPPMPHLAN